MKLEEKVGRQLVIGIPGTRATPEIVRHFRELHAGGLILYRINFESPAQLKKLISELESALGRRLLVTADHEGGRVIMFRDGITVFPDNLALGRTGKKDYARRQGALEARELRRLGVDVNLSPTLDVLTETYSPNIGIRSYSRDWKIASELGSARIAAMQKGGVSACAKHFPGKGHASVDAHLDLPTIASTWADMEAVHLKPFRHAIAAGVDMVMTSHPYYPNLDPDPKNIATFSKILVRDLLRGRLDFRGVICSDDLEMGAIKAICPIGEAGVRALEAGHDILLVCHDLEAQREVYRHILAAYRVGRLSWSDLDESLARVEKLQSRRSGRFAGGAPRAEPGGAKLAETIARRSAAFLKSPGRLPKLKGKKVCAIFPRFSELADKIMIEKDLCAEEKFLKREFAKSGVKVQPCIVGIEPSDSEIRGALESAKKSDAVVVFCYDAHIYPSNKKLLDAAQDCGKPAVAALLRDPYDADFIREGVPCLSDFGWRACQVRAVIRKMCR